MQRPEGERIVRLEEQIKGMRGDVQAMTETINRNRVRLHELESTTKGLVTQEKIRREVTGQRQRRLEVRMQILTAAVAAAALLEPFLYQLATGK